MPKPSEAFLWYFRLFKPYVEENQLLQNSPEDWSRLQVFDGNSLKPVMPEGFSGIPSKEQIDMLYTHMQNKELFFFELGDPMPKLVDKGERYSISRDFAEPTEPQPPQAPNPSKEEQSQYAQAQEEYRYQLTQYQLSQEVFGKYGDRFQAAVNDYHSGRNMEQDRQERDAREANSTLERTKILRSRANRVISEVMAPRPSAPADVFFETEQQGRNATLRFSTYDNQLAPNGYDLPQNSRLSEDEAATINFAMLGVRSEIVKALMQTGKVGPVNAQSAATDDFSYMVTGLFGEPRINQRMVDQLGFAMQMGQEAIEQYNGGHPELLGQRLGEAVQNLKTVFTGTGQYSVTQDLVAATKLTERLLGLFSKNPDIWKATGLPDQELDKMRGYVQIGNLYDNYLDSAIKFNAAKAKGTDLSREEKAEILADTVIRRMVEKELEKDSHLVEDSKEYTDIFEEAAAKDLEAQEKLAAWEAENENNLPQEEFNKQKELMQNLFDYNIHVTFAATQPVEHPILAKLAQPGMLERLRQNLMKDPAILKQAGKSLPEFDPENRTMLNTLAEQAQSLVELSRAQVEWNKGFQTMLVQARHNFETDNDRLMIAQTDAKGVKTMVSLSSLLEGGLQALLDPKSNGLDLLYENAKNGNLYFRSTNQGIPTRLNADGGAFSAQPMQRPTLWMRFANTITFGWAYAKECEAAEAYDNYVKATQVSEAVAPKVEKVPLSIAEQERRLQEQLLQDDPQPEPIKQVEIKPWKYQATDTRNMTDDDFLAHVEAAMIRGPELSVENALASESFTPEAYFEVITQRLEAQVARNIRDRLSIVEGEKRSQLLEAHKQTYTALVVGLGEYVFSHTNKEDLAAYCSHPEEYSEVYHTLKDSADEIIRTGVFKYMTQLKQENAANEQAKQQEQPKNEATLENKNQQEINPFAKG